MGLLTGLCLAACKEHKPVVPPLSIDLPISYKSDSAAYYFMLQQVDIWNSFGKEIASMYQKGEKFRQKDFKSLSQRELQNLLKLDLEYALLWEAQDRYLDNMVAEADWIMQNASPQGAAKITETQRQTLMYYRDLVLHFGKDLQLDQEPLPLDSLGDFRLDLNLSQRDSLLFQQLMPDPLPFLDSLQP